MLRYLAKEEKGKTRDLWEEAFPEDSRAFDDYYYREKIKENRILAIEEDGRIQSMIHLNPYLLQARNQKWRVDYLVGVATRMDKRHQGYMRRLLLKMMEDMHEESTPFCFLMPADEKIYRPFGFTYIYDQPQWRLCEKNQLERCLVLADSSNKAELTQVSDWMDGWLKKRYCMYSIRDLSYVSSLSREIHSENGSIYTLYDNHRMVGIESSWGLEKREQRFLYCEEIYREEAAPARPAIMARIITPETFVQVVSLKRQVKEEEISISLQLEDPLIPKNQRIWRWNLNHQTSWLEPWEGEADVTLGIEELTGWLFGYDIPKKAAPYGEMVRTLSPVLLDEIV